MLNRTKEAKHRNMCMGVCMCVCLRARVHDIQNATNAWARERERDNRAKLLFELPRNGFAQRMHVCYVLAVRIDIAMRCSQHYKWAHINSSIWQKSCRINWNTPSVFQQEFITIGQESYSSSDAYNWHNFHFGYVYYSNIRSISITGSFLIPLPFYAVLAHFFFLHVLHHLHNESASNTRRRKKHVIR